MPKSLLLKPLPLVLTLIVLAPGCATPSQPTAPAASRPQALPLAAQAEPPPRPAICEPTCLRGWSSLVETLASMLTGSAAPSSPAAPNTKP